jgi:hypothetical protein
LQVQLNGKTIWNLRHDGSGKRDRRAVHDVSACLVSIRECRLALFELANPCEISLNFSLISKHWIKAVRQIARPGLLRAEAGLRDEIQNQGIFERAAAQQSQISKLLKVPESQFFNLLAPHSQPRPGKNCAQLAELP